MLFAYYSHPGRSGQMQQFVDPILALSLAVEADVSFVQEIKLNLVVLQYFTGPEDATHDVESLLESYSPEVAQPIRNVLDDNRHLLVHLAESGGRLLADRVDVY